MRDASTRIYGAEIRRQLLWPIDGVIVQKPAVGDSRDTRRHQGTAHEKESAACYHLHPESRSRAVNAWTFAVSIKSCT